MTRKPSNTPIRLDDPRYFIDRELSWIAFNERVLEEAEDPTTPLLEKLKFLGIVSSNLDEFFQVRVSGIEEQREAGVLERNFAGYTPAEQHERVHRFARKQVARQYACLNEIVLPALRKAGITIRRFAELTATQKDELHEYFDQQVFPVLTPLAVDSGHPFPHLRSLSLNLAVRLAPPRGVHHSKFLFAVVQVPAVLDRIIRVPQSKGHEFLLLEDLISEEVKLLFPGIKVLEVCAFRVTRDADLDFAEEEADDLLKTVEEELRRRERGNAVRLTITENASEEVVTLLRSSIKLDEPQVYRLNGPINLAEVSQIVGMVDRPELKYPVFTPSVREPLRSEKNIFIAVAKQDVLVHHPYESFSAVEDFIGQAARDPNVLAIKQTLYRTSRDSAILKSLIEAAERGKQVAALMELKARFDEERNIVWARELEKAGVHVVYGLVGLKTHAKVCLVVRKEPGGIRRYVHLATGNYNSTTARLYTDVGLISCDPDLCDDASELFNMLTGYSRMPEWRKMIVAPMRMRASFVELIDGEIVRARAGGIGRIRAKMNSLVDEQIIQKLYEASRAGVQIDLIVRGVCCLRPNLPGISENIRVSSIVDRFLEHSRIFIFGHGEHERAFLSSADWMTRNLDRRVEAVFPIESPELKKRLIEEIWGISASDNVKRRKLMTDGTYMRITRHAEEKPLRSQMAFLDLEQDLRQVSKQVPAQPKVLSAPAQGAAGPEPLLPPVRPAKPAARAVAPEEAMAKAKEIPKLSVKAKRTKKG